jgi:DNA-binding transcriptional ArsR family regulator
MRPPAKASNHAQHPLNSILGSEASVRLLRLLSEERQASAADLASMAGLTLAGATRALARLGELGLVSTAGRGRAVLFSLHRGHSLSALIVELFQGERALFGGFVSAARSRVADCRGVFLSWLEFRPKGGKYFGPDAILRVVTHKAVSPDVMEELREDLARLAAPLAIDLEITVVTKIDWEALGEPPASPPWEIVLVEGPDPRKLWATRGGKVNRATSPKASPHRAADQRGLELGQRLAKALEKDSSLIKLALEKNREWAGRVGDGEKSLLREWERILRYSTPARVCKILREPSERGNRLRQSIVFSRLEMVI